MKTNSIRARVRIISFLCALILVLGASAAVNAKKVKSLGFELENSRQRSLMALTETLDSITSLLLKSEYGFSEDMLSRLSFEIGRNAAQAKSYLSALECPDDGSTEIYKFLSQVGEYTAAAASDEKRSAESLSGLYTYSKALSDGVEKICRKYYDGEITFSQTVAGLGTDSEQAVRFSKELYDTQQSFTDYPELIYDGPFSETKENKVPGALEGEKQISAGEAKTLALKILSSASAVKESDEEGTIPLYCFSSGGKTVGITKYGGKLCYLISSGYASAVTVSEEQAVENAEKYLSAAGYPDMKSTYYSVYDGICTINFAYYSNGVTCYTDLIKVGVSLDTGKVCSLDARGFLMNHRDRGKLKAKLTPSQAEKKLDPDIIRENGVLTLIPVNEKELLCYEFLCTDTKGRDALVYINAENGKEEQVLLLLYSDSGTLTK